MGIASVALPAVAFVVFVVVVAWRMIVLEAEMRDLHHMAQNLWAEVFIPVVKVEMPDKTVKERITLMGVVRTLKGLALDPGQQAAPKPTKGMRDGRFVPASKRGGAEMFTAPKTVVATAGPGDPKFPTVHLLQK